MPEVPLTMAESVYRGFLGLTYDEEEVLRDLVGSRPEDDKRLAAPYLNALHTLRIKVALRYSQGRGVDVEEAVVATERIADHARQGGLPIRLYWDWDNCSYEFRVGDREWRWDTLHTLLPRAGRELGLVGASEPGAP
jgi:hypothetical protein